MTLDIEADWAEFGVLVPGASINIVTPDGDDEPPLANNNITHSRTKVWLFVLFFGYCSLRFRCSTKTRAASLPAGKSSAYSTSLFVPNSETFNISLITFSFTIVNNGSPIDFYISHGDGAKKGEPGKAVLRIGQVRIDTRHGLSSRGLMRVYVGVL